MGKYSQNNEDEIINDYFKNFIGTVLDIGSNDGVTLSNSRAMILQGWSGVMVEPGKRAFEKLKSLYDGVKKVQCFEVAISNASGKVAFYSSGTHLNKGDTDLLSTMNPAELDRWKDTPNHFVKTTVDSILFKQLLKKSKFKKFDLISIDAEGVDYDILKQIDLEKVECKMLIVETNGKENEKYISYCESFGMKLHNQNMENLIFVK